MGPRLVGAAALGLPGQAGLRLQGRTWLSAAPNSRSFLGAGLTQEHGSREIKRSISRDGGRKESRHVFPGRPEHLHSCHPGRSEVGGEAPHTWPPTKAVSESSCRRGCARSQVSERQPCSAELRGQRVCSVSFNGDFLYIRLCCST